MNHALIKVCGMRDADNIREVEELAEEFSILNSQPTVAANGEKQLSIFLMGFIFWPHSSRYVSERPAYLPTHCKRVGVFVDASIKEITQKVQEFGLDIIQLHGSESPAYIRQLRSVCGDSIATIKAFNIATADDFAQTEAYEGIVDFFLFDTKGKSVGGNGEKFDWSVLADYAGNTPFLLSGGIGPDDAPMLHHPSPVSPSLTGRDGVGLHHPKCIGIDLNSRFETAPAIKDVEALRRFLTQLIP